MFRRAPSRRPLLPWLTVISLILMLVVTAAVLVIVRDDADRDSGGGAGREPATAADEDEGGCHVDRKLLRIVWRGYRENRSGDVLAIERLPHQFGTRHSSPHPYTQDVPLVLYGPGFIRSDVTVQKPVTVADLAPTFAELMGFDDFPRHAGRVLQEALRPEGKRNGKPKLMVTLVWDGGGINVLEQWPDSWPNLKALASESVWYENATVGSSPSITPAVHATIGTGAYPNKHGLPDIKIRVRGEIIDAWEGGTSRYLDIPTLGDLWDTANNNEPLVGAQARDNWHLGMLGHGERRPGADADIAVLDSFQGVYIRNEVRNFHVPEYLKGSPDLSQYVTELDRKDGEIDGMWLDNALNPEDPIIRYSPAWPPYQTGKIEELLRREGFGRDDVTDIFYTNYKSIDLAGHQWNMLDDEVRDVVEATDAELPRLIEVLDGLVGKDSYVLAVTADHGMTPRPSATQGWNIDSVKLTADIERTFNPNREEGDLVLSQRGYQLMLDRGRAKELGVSHEDVAEFIRNYTIADNVDKGSRDEFEQRFQHLADERLYLTALTPNQLRTALKECD